MLVPPGRVGLEPPEQLQAARILHQPVAEPGPRPHQGLVGDHHVIALDGQEPCRHQPRDDVRPVRVAAEVRGGDAPTYRPFLGRRHETQQHGPNDCLPLRREGLEELLRRRRDGAAQASRRQIVLHCQDRAGPARPRLGERMGQQRECAGLPLGVAYEHLHQAGATAHPRPRGGAHDGRPEGVAGQRSQEVEGPLHQPRRVGVDREPSEVVAPHHEDDPSPGLHPPHHRREQRGGIRRRGAVGERLLHLVDGDHRRRLDGAERGPHSLVGRPQDHAGQPAAPQLRQDPRPQEGGFPGPRGAGEHEQPGGEQPLGALGDVGIAAEEHIRVLLAVGLQSRPRRRRRRRHRLRRQGGLLPQDRQLEGGELGAGVDAELLHQHHTRLREGGESVALVAGAVVRAGEQGPPPFPEGLLAHQRGGAGDNVSGVARGELRLDQVLLRGGTQFGQPRHLRLRGLPCLELRVGRAAPQLQGAAEIHRRTQGIVVGQMAASLVDEALEDAHVGEDRASVPGSGTR